MRRWLVLAGLALSLAACGGQPTPPLTSRAILPDDATIHAPTAVLATPEHLDRTFEDTAATQAAREALVSHFVAPRVADERVVAALREVPRHSFVPTNLLGSAYNDHPLPIGYGQTISQPSLVAIMTELLALEPGDRVLEIGTGSGYQAAILRELTDQV